MRFIKKLKGSRSSTELIENGRSIYTDLVEKTNDIFYTSGFKNYHVYIEYLTQKEEKVRNRLVREILDENIEFTMNVNHDLRNSIKENGFLNQFTSKGSDGVYDPEGRVRSEAALLGIRRDEYEEISPLVRPKYASLGAGEGSVFKKDYSNVQYGQDVFLFKKDAIKDRVTFTLKDSYELGYMVSRGLERSWSTQFIPWENRGLIIPTLIEQLEKKTPILETGYQSKLENFKIKASTFDQLPPEIQIWGPLTMDEVESFIFLEKVPSGKFLQMLEDKNIKILDGRSSTSKPVLWSPVSDG